MRAARNRSDCSSIFSGLCLNAESVVVLNKPLEKLRGSVGHISGTVLMPIPIQSMIR